MFCPLDLAARLDRTEAALCARMSRVIGEREPHLRTFVMPIAAGSAVYAGEGSPMNKLIGAGFGCVPDESELAAIEAAYAERGSPFQAEVSTLAEPAFTRLLLGRGYRLQGYENQLARTLSQVDSGDPRITIERCTIADDIDAWIEMLADAFTAADVGGVGGDIIPPRDAMLRWGRLSAETPGLTCYAARLNGDLAGGGALFVDGGVAMLGGAGTLPVFRRRGVQTALLRARLADGARQGAEFAMVTTQPGSKSQQNVTREGFSLVYSRALLVKEP